MTPFFVGIRQASVAGKCVYQVDAPRGVSAATALDRSFTVVLLGDDTRVEAATRTADSMTRDGRAQESLMATGVGAVVLDHARGTVSAYAAPIGLRQIYWMTRPGEIRLASDPRRLRAADACGQSMPPEAVFEYLYFHMLPGPGSAFTGVCKLDGGHCLEWGGHGAVTRRYWYPKFNPDRQVSEAGAARELRRLLQESVVRSLQAGTHPGAFLSGGLDSSTVAGCAAEAHPGITTISMGFDAEGYDEIAYARIAATHFKTTPIEYYVTPDDVLQSLPALAAAFPEPFGNSSAAAVYHCARIAREHGIDLLLAGDGGDEIFGGNQRYATQLMFEAYGRIPYPLRSGVIAPLASAAGRMTRAFPVGKVLNYIQKAEVPLPDRLQAYNFLHRHDPREVFEPDMLAQVDTAAPLRRLREEFNAPETDSVVDRMLFMDWKFTLHDNDLVKVNTMCDLAGVRVAYPMLDQNVVDFSTRLPGDWKVRRGHLRWFYKRAMRGFLPPQILSKTKHGFGLPFGLWTRTHQGLRRLSEDALESLGKRGYIKPDFLRSALRLHREGHATYYGELVWVLMILELWLQEQGSAATGARA